MTRDEAVKAVAATFKPGNAVENMVSAMVAVGVLKVDSKFEVGDKVEKITGDYLFPGEVIAVILKKSKAIRYAVEDDRGAIHIFNAEQLAAR